MVFFGDEEDKGKSEFRKSKKNSRRSSILKPSKSPGRNALSDLDPNANCDDETTTVIPGRPRKSRRVSFANTYQVKEFCKESNLVQQLGLAKNDVEDPQPKAQISGLDQLLRGNIENDVPLDFAATMDVGPVPSVSSSAHDENTPAIDGISFLKTRMEQSATSASGSGLNETQHYSGGYEDNMDMTGCFPSKSTLWNEEEVEEEPAPKIDALAFLRRKGFPTSATNDSGSLDRTQMFGGEEENNMEMTGCLSSRGQTLGEDTMRQWGDMSTKVFDDTLFGDNEAPAPKIDAFAFLRKKGVDSGDVEETSGKIDAFAFLRKKGVDAKEEAVEETSGKIDAFAFLRKKGFVSESKVSDAGEIVPNIVAEKSDTVSIDANQQAALSQVSERTRTNSDNDMEFTGCISDLPDVVAHREILASSSADSSTVSDSSGSQRKGLQDITHIFTKEETQGLMEVTLMQPNVVPSQEAAPASTAQEHTVHFGKMSEEMEMTTHIGQIMEKNSQHPTLPKEDHTVNFSKLQGDMEMTTQFGKIMEKNSQNLTVEKDNTVNFSKLQGDMEMTTQFGRIMEKNSQNLTVEKDNTVNFSKLQGDMEMTTQFGKIMEKNSQNLTVEKEDNTVHFGKQQSDMEMTTQFGKIRDRMSVGSAPSEDRTVHYGVLNDTGMEMTQCVDQKIQQSTSDVSSESTSNVKTANVKDQMRKRFSVGLAEKSRMFSSDDCDMDVTKCVKQSSPNVTLTGSSKLLEKGYDGSGIFGSLSEEMEMTKCLKGTGVAQLNENKAAEEKTEVFLPSSADMEMTTCATLKNFGTIGSGSTIDKTQMFSQDAEMEMTKCLKGKDVAQLNENKAAEEKTEVFLPSSADMEMTTCATLKNFGTIGSFQKKASTMDKTQMFSQDAEMEMTKCMIGKDVAQLTEAKAAEEKTEVFLPSSADMEMTTCATLKNFGTIGSGQKKSSTMDKTQMFSQDAEMDMTTCIKTKQPLTKSLGLRDEGADNTCVFSTGAEMETTKCISYEEGAKSGNRSLVQSSNAADMDETKCLPSKEAHVTNLTTGVKIQVNDQTVDTDTTNSGIKDALVNKTQMFSSNEMDSTQCVGQIISNDAGFLKDDDAERKRSMTDRTRVYNSNDGDMKTTMCINKTVVADKTKMFSGNDDSMEVTSCLSATSKDAAIRSQDKTIVFKGDDVDLTTCVDVKLDTKSERIASVADRTQVFSSESEGMEMTKCLSVTGNMGGDGGNESRRNVLEKTSLFSDQNEEMEMTKCLSVKGNFGRDSGNEVSRNVLEKTNLFSALNEEMEMTKCLSVKGNMGGEGVNEASRNVLEKTSLFSDQNEEMEMTKCLAVKGYTAGDGVNEARRNALEKTSLFSDQNEEMEMTKCVRSERDTLPADRLDFGQKSFMSSNVSMDITKCIPNSVDTCGIDSETSDSQSVDRKSLMDRSDVNQDEATQPTLTITQIMRSKLNEINSTVCIDSPPLSTPTNTDQMYASIPRSDNGSVSVFERTSLSPAADKDNTEVAEFSFSRNESLKRPGSPIYPPKTKRTFMNSNSTSSVEEGILDEMSVDLVDISQEAEPSFSVNMPGEFDRTATCTLGGRLMSEQVEPSICLPAEMSMQAPPMSPETPENNQSEAIKPTEEIAVQEKSTIGNRSMMTNRSVLSTSTMLLPNLTNINSLSHLSIIQDIQQATCEEPSSIDDYLEAFHIDLGSSCDINVRQSTVAPRSLKPPESIGDYIMLGVQDCENQVLEWAVNQMKAQQEKSKERGDEIGNSLMENPPKILKMADDAVSYQKMHNLKTACVKLAKKDFKLWRAKMVKSVLEGVKEENIWVEESKEQLKGRVSQLRSTVQKLRQAKEDVLAQREKAKIEQTKVQVERKQKYEQLQGELHALRCRRAEQESNMQAQSGNNLDNLKLKLSTLRRLLYFDIKYWKANRAVFSLFKDRVDLTATLGDKTTQDGKPCSRVTHLELMSTLNGRATGEEKFAVQHMLGLVNVEELQNGCPTTACFPKVLQEVSRACSESSSILRDLQLGTVTHDIVMKQNILTVTFSSLPARCRFKLAITVQPGKYLHEAMPYSYIPGIGKTRASLVSSILEKISPAECGIRHVIETVEKQALQPDNNAVQNIVITGMPQGITG